MADIIKSAQKGKMKIHYGKIIEATEAELFDYYVKSGWSEIMSYIDFKERCIKQGTKVIEDKENDNDR